MDRVRDSLLMLALLVGAALALRPALAKDKPGSDPTPVAIEVGTDHYFGSDALTSAEYLHLQADGRYTVVDVQHMFTDVVDAGHWRVDGGSVLLESDDRVRNIDAGRFTVHVFDRCGEEMLPELRASLKTLRDRGEPVSPDVLDELHATRAGHPLGRGPDKLCGAALSYIAEDYPAKPVPAERLDPVIAAIDAWLADSATQHIFEYQAWAYRGERFLVSMRAGMHAVQSSVDEIRKEMDENDGRRATYEYYAITAKQYAQQANCTYAFKFYPGLNAPCNAP